MIPRSFLITVYVCLFLITSPATSLEVQPYFPATPASCPICAQGYSRISSCAAAAPVLSNFSSVIFNPGAFISVIKCSCTDTFQSVFPQCADCFERTNQTAVLDTPNLPSLVNSIRKICALESTLVGNVSNSDGETTSSSTSSAASTTGTGTSSAAPPRGLPGSTVSSIIAGAVALLIVFGASLP